MSLHPIFEEILMSWKLTPIPHSSNIEGVAHDPETQTMRVNFKNGGWYAWKDVTAEQVEGLVNAESPGRHLGKHFPRGSKVEESND